MSAFYHCYEDKQFRPASVERIEQADAIIKEYAGQGFDLTLRQLYYQFVARDLIPNTERSYKSLGSLIGDARMAGLLPWDLIQDRTRSLSSLQSFVDPAALIDDAVGYFHLNKWEGQEVQVEVWIEKEALVGVIEGVCRRMDVPFFACRGYVSLSEMWRAGRRIINRYNHGQETHILHLGDHDPSGIDMTRDIKDRLAIFTQRRPLERRKDSIFNVDRIALNMDQIEEFGPPPNPAKVTDSRFEAYSQDYGDESWELDALEPQTIENLIESETMAAVDMELWDERFALEEMGKEQIRELLEGNPNLNW